MSSRTTHRSCRRLLIGRRHDERAIWRRGRRQDATPEVRQPSDRVRHADVAVQRSSTRAEPRRQAGFMRCRRGLKAKLWLHSPVPPPQSFTKPFRDLPPGGRVLTVLFNVMVGEDQRVFPETLPQCGQQCIDPALMANPAVVIRLRLRTPRKSNQIKRAKCPTAPKSMRGPIVSAGRFHFRSAR